jgi:hypothetical protein
VNPLFSLRTAVIMIAAVGCGVVVAGLTYVAYGNAAAALLAGIAATGSSMTFMNRIVAP